MISQLTLNGNLALEFTIDSNPFFAYIQVEDKIYKVLKKDYNILLSPSINTNQVFHFKVVEILIIKTGIIERTAKDFETLLKEEMV